MLGRREHDEIAELTAKIAKLKLSKEAKTKAEAEALEVVVLDELVFEGCEALSSRICLAGAETEREQGYTEKYFHAVSSNN